MKYLQIKNAGEINPNALSLMGASTKRGDDGKIGFFGTGNKYALALFLRSNLDVKIYSGTTPIQIATKTASLGDESYSVVQINGESTSITTDMGPTWKIWQAVREVYSNALDCGETSISIVDKPDPAHGITTYCVEVNDEIQAVYDNFPTLFSTGREPAERWGEIARYDNGTGTIYRHGIRCNAGKQKSVFDYEVGNVSLSEDRIANYSWQVGQQIWKSIFLSDDIAAIESCMRVANSRDYLEGEHAMGSLIDFPLTCSDSFKSYLSRTMIASNEMAPLMTEDEKRHCVALPLRMVEHLINIVGKDNLILPRKISSGGSLFFTELEMSDNDKATINRCLGIMANSGVHVRYPVIMVEFSDPRSLAYADIEGKRILISEKQLVQGDTMIVSAILEEWVHIKHDVRDETREMQCAIFNEFATVIMGNSENVREAA